MRKIRIRVKVEARQLSSTSEKSSQSSGQCSRSSGSGKSGGGKSSYHACSR